MRLKQPKFSILWLIPLLLGLTTGCMAGPTPAQSSEGEHSLEHAPEAEAAEHEHDDHAHDEAGAEPDQSAGRVPNNGAVVKIVSPQDEAVIAHETDLVVEIETENFELGVDGNHWHIFVDGESRGMITGVDYDEVLRGLEPGLHEIGAFLSNGAHEELAEGATITITVVE